MIIDSITKLSRYAKAVPGLDTVVKIYNSLDWSQVPVGQYTTDDPLVRYNVFTYDAAAEVAEKAEYHRRDIDVQIILSGSEYMELSCELNDDVIADYDEKIEAGFIKNKGIVRYFADSGKFALFFPGEPHATSIKPSDGVSAVKKVVFKIIA